MLLYLFFWGQLKNLLIFCWWAHKECNRIEDPDRSMFLYFSVRTFRFYLVSWIIADFVFFFVYLLRFPSSSIHWMFVCAFFIRSNLLLLNVCTLLIERDKEWASEWESEKDFRFLVVQIRIYYRASTNGFSCTPAISISLCHTSHRHRHRQCCTHKIIHELKTNK